MKKKDIIEEVCNHYGVSTEEVKSHRRDPKTVSAKKVIYYILRLYGESYKSIGRSLNKDHGTILATVKTISKEDKEYAKELYKRHKKIELEDEKIRITQERLKIIEMLNSGYSLDKIIKETKQTKEFVISQINFFVDNEWQKKVPIYSKSTYKTIFYNKGDKKMCKNTKKYKKIY